MFITKYKDLLTLKSNKKIENNCEEPVHEVELSVDKEFEGQGLVCWEFPNGDTKSGKEVKHFLKGVGPFLIKVQVQLPSMVLEDSINIKVNVDNITPRGNNNEDEKAEIAINNKPDNSNQGDKETLFVEKKNEKHDFHYIDYSYLRPNKKWLVEKSIEQEFTYLQNEQIYRNIYYGVSIPEEQILKTEEYNNFIEEELLKGNIVPNMPEFWSFHDSWRFADAAQYKKENMVRDAVNHSPWIESMKKFSLSDKAAEILTKGSMYLFGRDKNGYANIIIDLINTDTSETNMPFLEEALIFLSAVVKKYAL